jgi:small subunit ribosomal protein S5
LGSSNPHNQVKATLNALQCLISAKAMAAKRVMSINQLFNA